MAYKKLIIYYFSGTGNSRNVASWLADDASKYGFSAELINIAQVNRLQTIQPPPDAILAFCSPVHGFNYPPVMLSFIQRFPKSNNPVLLLNTRAGMLIGKWVTPGLSGLTFLFATFVLRLKGYRIRAMFPVDLPSNWISVHPGLNEPTVKYLHLRNRLRISEFSHRIFNGQSDFRALRELVQDVLISPVSLGYYFIGRFIISKTYYASADCTQCNVCVKQCPVKAIKLIDNRPFWTFKCESCMHCMSFCPHKAIETAHGSILVFSLFFSGVVWVTIQQFAGVFLHLDNQLVSFVLQSLLFLALLGMWYRIMHLLLRFRWFNRMLTYTSLTHFRFWGRRYKALNDREIEA